MAGVTDRCMTEDLCRGTSEGRAGRHRRGEVKLLELMARRMSIDFVEFIVRDCSAERSQHVLSVI